MSNKIQIKGCGLYLTLVEGESVELLINGKIAKIYYVEKDGARRVRLGFDAPDFKILRSSAVSKDPK